MSEQIFYSKIDFIEIAKNDLNITLTDAEAHEVDKLYCDMLVNGKIIEDSLAVVKGLIKNVSEGQALRFNSSKPQWGLVDFKSLEPMVRVLEFGATKYAPHNWKKGLDRTELLESMMRHLSELFDGEEVDEESKQLHAAHLMCNTMFYIYHYGK